MNEMIARAARAMAKRNGHLDYLEEFNTWQFPLHHQGAGECVDYLSMARAAVEALREPTEEMLASLGERPVWREGARLNWQRMCDEVLS